MDYKIKDLCSTFDFGVSKFYKLKENLDNSIPEQNRTEYYYNKGRNFYITDKGFEWFKNNLDNVSKSQTIKNNSSNNITIYQNQIIEMYKQENEYLKQENKRLLDIISVKEQKELAKDIKYIGNNENISFWDKFFNKFKK
ncbi:MAG: hypothetical protein K1W33_00860 [Clostridia bacterium]